MNGFNLSDITDASLGATSLSSIYLGSNKLWPTIPPDPYSLIPVTIENISDDIVTLTVTGYGSRIYELYYSEPFSKADEPPITYHDHHTVYDDTYDFVILNPGKMIRLWAEDNNSSKSASNYYSIRSDGPINIYGNVKSLLDMDNRGYSMARYCLANYFNGSMVVDASHLVLPDTTLSAGCYFGMFKNCAQLTTVPKLPATALDINCYNTMFANCSSLVTVPSDLLPATTLTDNCYREMFNGCTSLTTTPALSATTLADYCYHSMFRGCSSLTAAPNLPATTLTKYCYISMFMGCTSLTTPPVMSATTLAQNCCNSMFRDDAALTTAPDLLAPTLASRCYYYMFRNCTSLQYIKCLATDISAGGCTNSMMSNVAATGTFVKPASMTSWTAGASGIPSGWTVIDI